MKKNLILISFSFFFSLFIAEGALYFYNRPKTTLVVPNKLFKNHAQLGFDLKSNHLECSKITGEKVCYQTNQFGRELGDFPSEHKILLLGDSRSFGFGINVQDTWAYHLQKKLKSKQIINLAVPGFGIDQMLLKAKNYLQDHKAHEAMVYLPFTDDNRHLKQFLFSSAKPIFNKNLSIKEKTFVQKFQRFNKFELGKILFHYLYADEIKFFKETFYSPSYSQMKAKEFLIHWQKENSIKLSIVTGIPWFCGQLDNCLYLKTRMPFIDQKGVNRKHISKLGNQVFADLVFQQFFKE